MTGSSERLGTVLDRSRWRVAVVLSGMGDAVQGLLPLFAFIALGQSVQVSAAAGAAYVGGTLAGNLLLWGKLADRVRQPRALIIAGTGTHGGMILGVALFPEVAGIIALAGLLGFIAVSMDGGVMRLVLGDLPDADRARAVVRYSQLLQIGLLLGFALAAGGAALLVTVMDGRSVLRVVMGILGGAVLLQSALVASTIGRRRAAPRVSSAVTDLATDGVLVLWNGSAGNMLRILRLSPRPAAENQLSDSLRLLLVIMVVLFLGFSLHAGVFSLYLRIEAGLTDGAVLGIILAGSLMTSMAVPRAGAWLDAIPAVQLQSAAVAIRAVCYAGFAVLSLEASAGWSIAAVGVTYLLSQTAWGILVPANATRIAELAPSVRRGEVTAYFNAAAAVGVVVGSTIGGVVAENVGFPALFAASAGVTILATFLLLRW